MGVYAPVKEDSIVGIGCLGMLRRSKSCEMIVVKLGHLENPDMNGGGSGMFTS